MSEEEVSKQKVRIDDIEYLVEDMTPEQITCVNHVVDLERKVSSAAFNLDQLQGGREFWMAQLKNQLNKPEEEAEAA